MKKIIILLISVCSLHSAFAVRNPDTYYFSVDLHLAANDKLNVTLFTPRIKKEEIVYYLPKIVPGTYALYNFGRFISNFKAYDSTGVELVVEKKDENGWIIKQAIKLDKITYDVEDTWDTDQKEDFVFEPCGSNIEEGKNFVINTHCFFGYFDEMKNCPYEVNVAKPKGFFGATGLDAVTYGTDNDTFHMDNYMNLVDSPIMYNLPDTTTIHIGDAEVLVSVYAQNKTPRSGFIAKNIQSILTAQKEYLGGQLPIKKYAFIIYLSDKEGRSNSYGALEHSYSSLYFLPEMPEDNLAQTIKDVAAHEFFHIVTPLSIHSEEIGNFDYNDPQMSRHLWLYEGVTEYFASNVQVKYGLMAPSAYSDVLRGKMLNAESFKTDLPFTELSKGCLTTYKDQYNNVYEKGALIGLCLDLKLLKLSEGKYGLRNLMFDLSKTYGKKKSFKDSLLFGQVVSLTYPEIAVFFKKYITGSNPLPFKECLAYAGIDYEEETSSKDISIGGIDLSYDQTKRVIVVASIKNRDEMGKELGYMEGDIIRRFNGRKVNYKNIESVFAAFYRKVKENDLLKVTVLRNGTDGKPEKVKLRARVKLVDIKERHIIKPAIKPDEQQLTVRKAWLGTVKFDK